MKCNISESELLVETFLFDNTPSYLFHIPLLNGAPISLNSTVHQEHVEIYHKKSFSMIHDIYQNFENQKFKLVPNFIHIHLC